MVGHIDTSGRMIIEGHNDLRGHFLVASKSSPAIYFTSEMQLKREVSEVRKAPDVGPSEQSHTQLSFWKYCGRFCQRVVSKKANG